ncbi:oligosaccharide flippase family protein [Mesorhizobium sp. BHbsci]
MSYNVLGEPMALEPSDMSESRNLTHKAMRGLSWSGGMLLVRTLLNVACTAVLARLISPQEYGVVGAAMIVGALGSSIANLGMSQVVIQRRDIGGSAVVAKSTADSPIIFWAR